MRRRGRRVGAVGLLAALALAAGCASVPVQQHPVEVGAGALRRPTSAADVGVRGARLVLVYLVRRDRLAPVYRPAAGGSPLHATMGALFRPPSHGEQARGFRSALPTGDRPLPVAVRGGIAYVSVPGRVTRLGVSDQVLAVGQLTDTLTQLGQVVAVQLVHHGHDVDIPLAGGRLVPGPVTAADYAPVTVSRTTRPRRTTQRGSARTDRSSTGSRG